MPERQKPGVFNDIAIDPFGGIWIVREVPSRTALIIEHDGVDGTLIPGDPRAQFPRIDATLLPAVAFQCGPDVAVWIDGTVHRYPELGIIQGNAPVALIASGNGWTLATVTKRAGTTLTIAHVTPDGALTETSQDPWVFSDGIFSLTAAGTVEPNASAQGKGKPWTAWPLTVGEGSNPDHVWGSLSGGPRFHIVDGYAAEPRIVQRKNGRFVLTARGLHLNVRIVDGPPWPASTIPPDPPDPPEPPVPAEPIPRPAAMPRYSDFAFWIGNNFPTPYSGASADDLVTPQMGAAFRAHGQPFVRIGLDYLRPDLDVLLVSAGAHGLIPWPLVTVWGLRQPRPADLDQAIAEAAIVFEALAARCPWVEWWEIENEPMDRPDKPPLAPKMTAPECANIVYHVGTAIKRGNPAAKITGPAAYREMYNPMTGEREGYIPILNPNGKTFYEKFRKELNTLGGLTLLDAQAIHPFRNPRPATFSGFGTRAKEHAEAVKQAAGLPIITTEVGWDDGGSDEVLAGYLLDELRICHAQGQMGCLPYAWAGPTDVFGIFHADLSPKPQALAIKQFAQEIGQLPPDTEPPVDPPGDHPMMFVSTKPVATMSAEKPVNPDLWQSQGRDMAPLDDPTVAYIPIKAINTLPDGSAVAVYPEGTLMSVEPDGRLVYRTVTEPGPNEVAKQDGNILWFSPQNTKERYGFAVVNL